jgi:hypothetical protein
MVYGATQNGSAAPIRVITSGNYFTALALGPGPDEFTASDGQNILIYPRSWSGTSPAPIRSWTLSSVSGIISLAIDPVSNEIWLGNSGNNRVSSIVGLTGRLPSGVINLPHSEFSLSPSTSRALSLAYDPMGEGGTPELLVGSYAGSGSSRQLAAYKLVGGTPTLSAYVLNESTLPTLGRIASMVVDSNLIIAVSTASRSVPPYQSASANGVAPYQQSIMSLTRLDVTSSAVTHSLNGPYQSQSAGVNSDAPSGIAGTSAATDQLWVANTGVPGGSGTATSTTKAYSMTSAVSSGTPLAVAINNSALSGGTGRGVAVNETAGEVYVSDGTSDVKVFSGSSGVLLRAVSTALQSPGGLYWDASSQRLYIAQQTGGSGSVGVWLRAGDGTFSLERNIATANVLNPSAVWVTTPASGNQQLWVANTNPPGAARIDLVSSATVTPFSDSSFSPTSIATDQTRAYLGASYSAGNPNAGVAVLTGATSGATSLVGYLRITGATPNVGGVTWCNGQ